ncbi:hypothetical protein [Streptomyces sp. NPDC049879]|uniref:hypothetical protein n=1 Tax=Streptomyces sp. NPDC049879 TaxID=3365598 RepID=UPI0037A5C4FF
MTTPPTVFVPRTPVQAPVVTPRRYTLLGSIPEAPGDADGRWERGVDYWSSNCNLRTGYVDGWCPPTNEAGEVEDWDKEVQRFDPTRVEGAPFTITSGVDCQSPVFPAPAEAEAALARGEDLQVEQRFWAMQMAREDLVELHPGDVVGLDDAIGYLEEEAAVRYAGQVFIHVPIRALVHLAQLQIVTVDRNVLRTPYGSIVIPAAGYKDQTGPAGAAAPANGWWLLATGQPVYRRSEVFSHEAFDVKTNRRGAIAERTYVITADCLAMAIQAAPCPCTPAPTTP